MAKNADALRAMSAGELDNVTGLNTRGDDGWQAIVTDVRDAVLEANDNDSWDVRRHDHVVHELADGLVPAYTREVVSQFRIIGAAWSADVSEFENYASLYDNWSQTLVGQTGADAYVTFALYMVYRAAVLALVETLEDAEDVDTDDSDES